ncbi:MAG: DsbA family protein [Chloroflexaceae bacterium]|nr:DsbA family protein [Chloroflexaceae bacterium]
MSKPHQRGRRSAPQKTTPSPSHTPQRGRTVAQGRSRSLGSFYWIVGLVILVGLALMVAYVLRTAASANEDQVRRIVEETILAEASTNLPGQSTDGIPTGTTSDGFSYKGDPNAPVTVLEYSDFQCPACAAFVQHPMYTRLVSDYVKTGLVQVVFHDFPLRMHPNAPIAAMASRCAGEQGKFWDMHDTLFQKQEEWASNATVAHFAELASTVGVSREPFVACLESGRYQQQIADAYQSSVDAGVGGTPMFRVDSGEVIGSGELFPAINAALEAKGLR